MRLLITLLCMLSALSTFANLGSSKARKGGTFYYNLGTIPSSLNPITTSDYYTSTAAGYAVETLLSRNYKTYDWDPALATKWETSKDGLTYTFTLREGVKFHDGKPFTSDDVKAVFDFIKDPKTKTAHLKPYYENISECKVLGKYKVQFKAKQKYHGNFSTVAGLEIVPKHLYYNPSKKMEKKLNKTIVGTGPYILDSFNRKKGLIFKKNKDWWGNNEEHTKYSHNYSKIHMRFVKDNNVSLEMVKKGRLDFEAIDTERFVKKAVGSGWGKKYHKVKAKNKQPKGYAFIGWNLTNPIFKDKNVRLAMAHLVNREMMIKKFLFNMSRRANGPVYFESRYNDNSIKPINFDIKKAISVLKKAGWKDTDNDRVLDKMINGKKEKLSFTILEPNKDYIKFLTIFKEDAKKAGVDVNVKYVEWTTFVKLLDERNFEAVRLAWSGGSIDWDPKQIWHSDFIKGGSNFVGYSNPEVDKLIDQAREELDADKREVILKKVHRIIFNDHPYMFFWTSKFATYVHTDRVQKVSDTYEYNLGLKYWWLKK